MPKYTRLAGLILLLAASLACSTLLMDDNERFVQGTWTHATNQGDGHGTYLALTFSRGRFAMQGYPPLEQRGGYRVAGSRGDTLTLDLFDQAGDLPTDDREMVIVIDRGADQLLVDGSGPYTRSGPQP
jgi:hypothetical protein